MLLIGWIFLQLTLKEMEAIGILVGLATAAYGIKTFLEKRVVKASAT